MGIIGTLISGPVLGLPAGAGVKPFFGSVGISEAYARLLSLSVYAEGILI